MVTGYSPISPFIFNHSRYFNEICDWLKACSIDTAAIEVTGIYGIPRNLARHRGNILRAAHESDFSSPFWFSFAIGVMSGLLFSVIAIVLVMPVFFPLDGRRRREGSIAQA
ncbi:MAG: hypothetical protein MJY77_06120 [Bacteroidaceae bacterium]|nr:hypothetical protein [Bacteroidaceae bacterium]